MASLGFGGLRKKWTPLSGAVEAPRRRGEHLGALSWPDMGELSWVEIKNSPSVL